MRLKQTAWKLLMVLVLAGLIAGCSGPTATAAPTAAPTQAATALPPTAAPTSDLQPTFNAIKTQAAETVIANMTQNAPADTPVPPATATQTPLPTATSAPSNTPLPPATSTPRPILTPWTLVPTQADYSCVITDYSPKVAYPPSSNFDVTWVIKNTGKQRWLASETDFRYVDGVKMQKFGDVVDLKTDVAPNGSYTIAMDAVAPASAGTYRITWQLTYGQVHICTLTMDVVIQ